MFFALMGLLSLIDMKYRLLPNWIVLPAIVIALAVYKAFFPALVMFGIMAIVYQRNVWAGGDVKLAVMVSAFLGWSAFLIVGLTFLLIRSWRKLGHYSALPVAPFMFASVIIVCGILQAGCLR